MKQTRQLRLIVKDSKPETWDHFKVKHNEVSRPLQKSLFGSGYCKRAHILMGTFYELISIAMYGGKLADAFFLDEEEKCQIKPDVFNEPEKRMIESKAVRSGHQFNILDEQIERYKTYQIQYPDFKIYYSIWRHALRNIKNYHKDHEELFRELCEKTVLGIILPFRLILAMFESNQFKRYETEKWHHCTRVNSPFLNTPLTDPTLFFSTLNVNPSHFEIKKYVLPPINVCGFKIEGLPIVVVRDLYYEQWATSWAEKQLENIPF